MRPLGAFPNLGRNEKAEKLLELEFIESAVNSEAVYDFLDGLKQRERGLSPEPMKRGETYEQYKSRLHMSQLAKDAYPVFDILKRDGDLNLAFMLSSYATVVDEGVLNRMESELDPSTLLAFRAFREVVSEVIDHTKEDTPDFALPEFLYDPSNCSVDYVSAKTQDLRQKIADSILAKAGVGTPPDNSILFY